MLHHGSEPTPSSSSTCRVGSVDVASCLAMGFIGGIGAVPGTICAYPLDVLKVRMQTTSSGGYRSAVQFILSGGHSGSGAAGLPGFYRGVVPAVELRVFARASAFLGSELCTQLVENRTSLTDMNARAAGSFVSGYSVGMLTGLAEYKKKLLSQGVLSASQAKYQSLLKSALHTGQGRSLLLRLHAAGCRSAMNDSCFFSLQHYLTQKQGWAVPASYACAATCGVLSAYFLDTVVARMMLVPPALPVIGVAPTMAAMVREMSYTGCPSTGPARSYLRVLSSSHRGIAARAAEFSISYGCTGLVGAWLATVAATWPSTSSTGTNTLDALQLWLDQDLAVQTYDDYGGMEIVHSLAQGFV